MNSFVSFRCIFVGKCSKIPCLPRNHLFGRPRFLQIKRVQVLSLRCFWLWKKDTFHLGRSRSPWVSLTLCPRWRPTLFALPNRRRPASEFLLIRWFVQLIQIQKKRRPSRAKQIQRNARHKLSSNIIKAWNDHSFNLECPSSGPWVLGLLLPWLQRDSHLISEVTQVAGSSGFWENRTQRVSDKLHQKYLVHRPINFPVIKWQNSIQTSTVPSSTGRTLSEICVKLLSWLLWLWPNNFGNLFACTANAQDEQGELQPETEFFSAWTCTVSPLLEMKETCCQEQKNIYNFNMQLNRESVNRTLPCGLNPGFTWASTIHAKHAPCRPRISSPRSRLDVGCLLCQFWLNWPLPYTTHLRDGPNNGLNSRDVRIDISLSTSTCGQQKNSPPVLQAPQVTPKSCLTLSPNGTAWIQEVT